MKRSLLEREEMIEKVAKMLFALCLLLPILALASAQDECKRSGPEPPFKHPVITSSHRFCPEDIKAAVFRPMVRDCSIMIGESSNAMRVECSCLMKVSKPKYELPSSCSCLSLQRSSQNTRSFRAPQSLCGVIHRN